MQANLKTSSDKYLILQTDGCQATGLDHILAILKSAIKEAISLDRTLVINKFSMDSQHNLGYKSENLEFKRYINLDKTQIYRVGENGNIQQINSLFHYIDTENFDLNKYSEKDILFIDRNIRPITEEENNRYHVIVRKTTDYDYAYQHLDILVIFYPSDEVERLTDVVLKTIGTSLADAKKRSLIYESIDFSANQDIFQVAIPNSSLYYTALHLRADDLNNLYINKTADLLNLNAPRNIKRIVDKAIHKGSRIYIMSNIHAPHHFDILKKNYVIYRYLDFPELTALVSKNNRYGIDNAMLYSVEKNILQHAYIKIISTIYTPKILYIDPFTVSIPISSVPRNLFMRLILKLLRIRTSIKKKYNHFTHT